MAIGRSIAGVLLRAALEALEIMVAKTANETD
jgi:hypothetical protein